MVHADLAPAIATYERLGMARCPFGVAFVTTAPA